jgi:hypothetical protein
MIMGWRGMSDAQKENVFSIAVSIILLVLILYRIAESNPL